MIDPLNDGLCRLTSIENDALFRQLNAITTQLYIVVMVPRPGGDRFLHELEWQHYTPGTPKNQDLNLYFTHWRNIMWTICSIPWKERENAHDICRKTGTRLANGYPMALKGRRHNESVIGHTRYDKILDKSEIIDSFPLSSDHTFSLEVAHTAKGVIPVAVMFGEGMSKMAFWDSLIKAAEDHNKDILKERAEKN